MSNPRRWYLTICWCDTACHAHTHTHLLLPSQPQPMRRMPLIASHASSLYCTAMEWRAHSCKPTAAAAERVCMQVFTCVRSSGRTRVFNDSKTLHQWHQFAKPSELFVWLLLTFVSCISVTVQCGKRDSGAKRLLKGLHSTVYELTFQLFIHAFSLL